jgi:hypothetical protein
LVYEGKGTRDGSETPFLDGLEVEDLTVRIEISDESDLLVVREADEPFEGHAAVVVLN